MNENIKKLLELIKENPDLPILPMVYYEIVAEDSGYWMGAWGNVCIGEYLRGDERIYFREVDDLYEAEMVLEEKLGGEAIEKMTDDGIREAYAALPWTKAIIVYIGLPD